MATSCNIRVMARFRPMNSREKNEAVQATIVQFTDDNQLVINHTNQGQTQQIPFAFDQVFPMDTAQSDIFETVQSSIDDVLNGYNATIFAYGQTGSGKSYTMFGEKNDAEQLGIIPRTSIHIFNRIAEDTSGAEFTIKCSFLEIYMEIIQDLLNPKNKNLKIRESKTNGIWIEGLTEEFISDEGDIMQLIELGESSRSVSTTNMNQKSSRSHSILIITIEQKSPEGSIKRGKLNLVDLAGSERVEKTGAGGQTLEEAKKINQSLSQLGNCIHALTESKRDHIPFRDSKLTRILQESLGGNTKTTLMVTCSPHIFNVEETLSTLKFGARAKTIKNQVKVNQQKSAAELLAIIGVMTKELQHLKMYSVSLEKLVEFMKSTDYIPGQTPLPDLQLLLPPPATAVSPNISATSSTPSTPSRAKTPTPSTPNSKNINRHSVSLTSTPPHSNQSTPSSSSSLNVNRHSVAISSPISFENGSRLDLTTSSESTTSNQSYNPMELIELTMQIDKIKEEHQMIIDKYLDEISEIKIRYETTNEDLIQVKAQLEQTKETTKQLEADSKIARDTERNLRVDLDGRQLRINKQTQQIEDLKMLATQVVQYLDRKKMTDDYFESTDSSGNDAMGMGSLSRSVSSTSLDEDSLLFTDQMDVNIEEVIRNLNEDEIFSMQVKLQLQTKVNILEQKYGQLTSEMTTLKQLLEDSTKKYQQVEREKKELTVKLQSFLEGERSRLLHHTTSSMSLSMGNNSVSGSSGNLGGAIERPRLIHTTTSMTLTPSKQQQQHHKIDTSEVIEQHALKLKQEIKQQQEQLQQLNQQAISHHELTEQVSLLQSELDQNELEKRNLDLTVIQLQQDQSELKEKELKMNQELIMYKNLSEQHAQEFQQYKEDVLIKSRLQQSQLLNLQQEIQSLKSKLNHEKKSLQKAQNQSLESNTKLNDLVKKYEDQEDHLKEELKKRDTEYNELQDTNKSLMNKCQDLQEELTSAQRQLMNRRVVKIIRGDEKSFKRAFEVKEDFGQNTLKKTGKSLW